MGPGKASLLPAVTGASAQVASQVVGPGTGMARLESPPLQPKRLAYFLTRVGNYLERYSALHPDELLCVDTITLNLEEDIVEWLVSLYDE